MSPHKKINWNLQKHILYKIQFIKGTYKESNHLSTFSEHGEHACQYSKYQLFHKTVQDKTLPINKMMSFGVY
jgi:hypothetical protein